MVRLPNVVAYHRFAWKTLENAQKKHELDDRGLRLWQNHNRLQEVVEGDSGGCQVLSIQRGPICLAPLQNPPAVEEHQHIPSPKKSHDIFLHTNAFDSNLDKNYTLLHPSSQCIIILLILLHTLKGLSTTLIFSSSINY